MNLKEHEVITIGGFSGIGLATATSATSLGAQVTLTGRDPKTRSAS